MWEIGQELKLAREKANISLDDISRKTMVSKRHLEALEIGDFDVFPGEVYLKGALRKYAGEVGLDPGDMVSRYVEIMEKEREDNEEKTQDESKLSREQIAAFTNAGTKILTGSVQAVRPMLYIAIFVFVMLALYLIYSILPFGSGVNSDRDPAAGENVVGDELDQDEGADENANSDNDGQNKEEEPVLQVDGPNTVDGDIVYTVSDAQDLYATLSFTGRCWVRLVSDGNTVEEGNFSKGQSIDLEAEKKITMRIGNPNALELVINGETVEVPPSNRAYNIIIEIED